VTIRTDFLVLGSGIAGLSFAREAAKSGSVLVVTKRAVADSATRLAQGGVAAALGADDSFERHAEDTMRTGGGLCDPAVVAIAVQEGPERVLDLVRLGARFSKRENGEDLDLTREGGHSTRRVVHADDMTGREVERVLVDAARTASVQIREDSMGVDLIVRDGRCVGAYVLTGRTIETILARVVVLATGGSGKVYLYTSNPDVASGDGVAMAYRAGAEIANMEFFQFHPTVLYHPSAKGFLISEALRGEGGILRLADGTPFMQGYARKDLEPRDVVARAIDRELKRTGDDCVYLDMTHLPAEELCARFPNIHAECLRFGIDMTTAPIPVVPGAHYQCGGVVVDVDGRTSLPGLIALGEVACTGLHGANRLASNSLLEGLVFAHRAARALAKDLPAPANAVPEWDAGAARPSDEAVVVTQNWDEIRRFMWNYVGIVRTTQRLWRASRRIALLQDEIREYYWDNVVTADLLELRNIATVAELVIGCALARQESRGLHCNVDFPQADDRRWLADTVVRRGLPPHPRARPVAA
jgi:L-aspartate oxidase